MQGRAKGGDEGDRRAGFRAGSSPATGSGRVMIKANGPDGKGAGLGNTERKR